MTAGDVVHQTVGHVLERQGNAARAVVLEDRHVDDLVHLLGDDQRHVRAASAGVLRIVDTLPDERQIKEDIWIIPIDPQLDRVKTPHGGVPAHPFGENIAVAGVQELVAVPVEDEDILGREAGRPQAVDDLQHDRGLGDRERTADGINLDADDVALGEEAAPGGGQLLLAGEAEHAAAHHLPHRLAVNSVVYD